MRGAYWLDVAGSVRPVDAWRMYRFLVLGEG
jgi:hypothetical protein